jgi:hypothetical protein
MICIKIIEVIHKSGVRVKEEVTRAKSMDGHDNTSLGPYLGCQSVWCENFTISITISGNNACNYQFGSQSSIFLIKLSSTDDITCSQKY